MLTIKQIERDGHEGIEMARQVSFIPGEGLTAFGCPGPDEGARAAGVVRYASGRIYVMNENGKTVATYDLDLPPRILVREHDETARVTKR